MKELKAQMFKSVRGRLAKQGAPDIESLHDQAFKPLRPLVDDLAIRPGTNPALWPLLVHNGENIFPGLSAAAVQCAGHAGFSVSDLCEKFPGRLGAG